MDELRVGGRFIPTRPLRLGRDAPRKLAARRITAEDVEEVLSEHVVVEVHRERRRAVLLGTARERPLVLVVADDELDDATVLVSAYEPDVAHGWTRDQIARMLDTATEEDR
jgi:hypothetical protein